MLHDILQFLPPDHPWRERVQYYDTITSTNDVLKQLALQGAPEGTVLVADSQSGGRGRLGRAFLSPPGVGIYLSVLLRPTCTPGALMHLTCASAEATCTAIEKAAGFRPGIKWTNDLVYHRRKLAGILTELGLNQDGSVSYAIIGIGINCCQQPKDFPPELANIAGSLSMMTGRKINRALVAARLIEALWAMNQILLSSQSQIISQYRRDCITLGQQVSILRGETLRYGTALEVDEQGALIVEYEDGTVETVNSGEVSVRGLYNYL